METTRISRPDSEDQEESVDLLSYVQNAEELQTLGAIVNVNRFFGSGKRWYPATWSETYVKVGFNPFGKVQLADWTNSLIVT